MKKAIRFIFLLLGLSLFTMTACINVYLDNSAPPSGNGATQDAQTGEQSVNVSPTPGPNDNGGKSNVPHETAALNTITPEPAPRVTHEPWTYEFDTVTLSGEQITQENFYGNTLTVLNVWATWCPPCIRELPELQKISEYYADQDIEVVGVLQDGVKSSGGRDESAIKTAEKLINDSGVSYKNILPDSNLTFMFIEDMQYFPTTYILGSKGNVLKVVVGAGDFNDWKESINEALQSIQE